jgi:pimeloyl-ACP methyl ester carboxylesterase
MLSAVYFEVGRSSRRVPVQIRSMLIGAALILCACDAAPRSDPVAFTSDRISVVTRGDGPDLILVPGVGAHADVWSAIADSLDENFRIHIVQVNGFAGTPALANAEGPVAAPVAEEIARYAREQALDRPALIGHSMGGSIGLMLAARHPETVSKLMVLEMPPYLGAVFGPPGSPPDSIRAMGDQLRAGFLKTPIDSPTVFEQMIPTMTRSDSARAVLLQYARDSHRPTVANAMHELMVTDLRPELSRISAPLVVLYVKPQELPISAEQFDSVMRESYANARQAKMVRVDDSNHYILIDQPGRVVSEIRSLMASPP